MVEVKSDFEDRDHFETCNIWAKRKGISVVIKLLSPMCFLSLPGAIYMWKKKKKKKKKHGKKSDFKGIFFLNWQQIGKVIRNFCWHQNFVPKGLSVLVLRLYTYIKSFKTCLKSYFKEIVLKLATKGQSDKGFLLKSTFVPKGLSAPTLGLYTCIKTLKYIPGPGVRWAFTGPPVLWLPKVLAEKLQVALRY